MPEGGPPTNASTTGLATQCAAPRPPQVTIERVRGGGGGEGSANGDAPVARSKERSRRSERQKQRPTLDTPPSTQNTHTAPPSLPATETKMQIIKNKHKPRPPQWREEGGAGAGRKQRHPPPYPPHLLTRPDSWPPSAAPAPARGAAQNRGWSWRCCVVWEGGEGWHLCVPTPSLSPPAHQPPFSQHSRVIVLQLVIKVLAHPLQHDARYLGECDAAGFRLGEAAWETGG